jgi:single-stranded DNA-binding protein
MTRGIEAACWASATRDAEVRTSKSGNEFATINVVVNDGTTDDSGRQVGTFIKIFAFSQHVATARQVKKGDKLYCEGSLQAGIWTTNDGQPRLDLTLKAFTLQKTGIGKSRPPRGDAGAPNYQRPIEPERAPFNDDLGF